MSKVLPLICAGIFIWILSGCAMNQTIQVSESQNGSRLEIKSGDTLVITLEGNPTTGYQWDMLPNTDGIVELQGDPEYKSSGNMVGSGGQYQFTFKGIKTGSTRLDLKYYRSFEAAVPPVQNFSLDITVK